MTALHFRKLKYYQFTILKKVKTFLYFDYILEKMKRFQVILFVLFLLAGLFFVGQGITGLVISQSCCFAPNCTPEDVCDAAKVQVVQENVGFTISGVLVLVSLGVYAWYRKHS